MRQMNSATHISRTDHFIYWLYQLLTRFQGGLLALLSGFLLGRVTNELSIPYTSWLDIVRGLFLITNRPANLLTWFSVVTLTAIPVLNQTVSRLHKRRQYERIFAALVERHKSPSLAPFKAIGWDGNLTLQSCPTLHRGWLTTEVKVYHNTVRYSIPKEYSQPYQEYFNRYYEEKRFFDDKPKIMLVKNPIAFSDSPTLILETQETLYSQVQFYRENVAVLTSKRDEYIRKAVQDLSIDFPHPLWGWFIFSGKYVDTSRTLKNQADWTAAAGCNSRPRTSSKEGATATPASYRRRRPDRLARQGPLLLAGVADPPSLEEVLGRLVRPAAAVQPA